MMLCKDPQLLWARETITMVGEPRLSLRKEFTLGADGEGPPFDDHGPS